MTRVRKITPFVIINDLSGFGVDPHYLIDSNGEITRIKEIDQEVIIPSHFNKHSLFSSNQIITDNLPMNPASYSILITHRDRSAAWTTASIKASVQLHTQIRHELADKYGVWIPLNRYHVISCRKEFAEREDAVDEHHLQWEPFYQSLELADDDSAVTDTITALECLKRKGLLL